MAAFQTTPEPEITELEAPEWSDGMRGLGVFMLAVSMHQDKLSTEDLAVLRKLQRLQEEHKNNPGVPNDGNGESEKTDEGMAPAVKEYLKASASSPPAGADSKRQRKDKSNAEEMALPVSDAEGKGEEAKGEEA